REYIRDCLLDELDYLSFASVDFRGTKLVVEIKEQDLPPKSIDMDTPCNIIATKKGIILKTIARNGRSMVRKGDVVEKGDILITGIITDEDPDVDDIFVHADGEVLAKTVYTHSMEEPIIKVMERETGEVYQSHELKFGTKGIRFSTGEIPFEDYVEEVRELKPFGRDIRLPIGILVHEYREVEVREEERDIDTLKRLIYMKAIEGINEQLTEKVEIESKDVKYTVDGDMLSVHIVVEAVEEIGVKRPINTN
ncbi:MAG: sporulation protein YqfD, partial [Tissierellia bacterium]|nr:sporulation protein YqfD [Tissierellia bacterium]